MNNEARRFNSDPSNAHFGSDNYAGVCPEVWDALRESGNGHHPAYGDDSFTQRACDAIREFFDTDCEVFFVFNGTAANALALASACQSYHSVICAATAHLETDECGAPEFFTKGARILVTSDQDGKVTPPEVARLRAMRHDVHYPKPRAVSIAQTTELGTVYSPAELRTLCDTAHEPLLDADNMPIANTALAVHMDGARFMNATASLEVAPKEISAAAGVDILSFGGTKIGMPMGEAVVFFNRQLADEFEYRCKQAGQLASKMRFLAIPWLALLKNNTWLKYAQNANARAAELEALVRCIPGVRILYPCQANAVFLQLPPGVTAELRQLWRFYTDISADTPRFMCAWDTTSDDVKALAADIGRLVAKTRNG